LRISIIAQFLSRCGPLRFADRGPSSLEPKIALVRVSKISNIETYRFHLRGDVVALPDYEGWACFVAVADHGSFTAASHALGLSKASVSKAVTRLEATLGITLFHRTSRSVTVSTAGEGLLGEARAMVAAAMAATEAALGDRADLAGLIRMAAPMSFGIRVLGDALSEFMVDHPAITIDLMLSDARHDLVAEGFDLALRISAMEDSSLLSRMIAPVPMWVVASPAYLENHGCPRHPLELSSHRLFGYGHSGQSVPLRFARGSEEASIAPTGPLFANNGDVAIPMLKAGNGIAMLPHFIVADALENGELVAILTDWQLPQNFLHLLSPPSRLRPMRVRALADFLAARLQHLCKAQNSQKTANLKHY
jgi:DNA-binding transcriptional LysR family regulator